MDKSRYETLPYDPRSNPPRYETLPYRLRDDQRRDPVDASGLLDEIYRQSCYSLRVRRIYSIAQGWS